MITVNRKQFTRALDLAAATVVNRGTIPILSNLKVTANGSLRLEGTDLDNWTCAELAYEGHAGDFTLPQPRMVRAAINQAGGEAVTVSPAENDAVDLRAGRLESTLSSLPAADFPFPDRIGTEEFLATLGAGELRQIARVMSAISSEETRYYLNGICVSHVADWTYRFAATNGHFLLMVDVPLPDAVGSIPNGTILSRMWLNLVMKRFAKAKEGVRLTYGQKAAPNSDGPDLVPPKGGPRVAMRADLEGIAYSVTGKLIDGQYPDYARIIPTDLPCFARFRRVDLVRAIHSLTSLTVGRYRAIKLTFPPGKVCCELNSPDLGKSVFDIEAEHNASDQLDHIGFNGQYLLATLNALGGEEVVMQVSDAAGPAVLTDPADTAFKAVLMPMRV